MQKQKFSISGIQWVRVIGLIIICSGLSTFASAAQSYEVKSTQQVSEHWRGAYDILVRPQSAVSRLESDSGLVEGNYLGTPGEVISMEQFRTIQAIDGIEVAAPVAAIGYMHNQTGSVSITLPANGGTFYHYSTTLLDGNGALINQQKGLFYSPLNCDGCGFNRIYPLRDQVCGSGTETTCLISLSDLPVLWTLVAGVDPAEEEKLIRLSSAIENGDMLQSNMPLQEILEDPASGQKATKIPILISQQSFAHQSIRIKVESFPVSEEDIRNVFNGIQSSNEVEAAMKRFEEGIDPEEKRTLVDAHFPLNEVIQPMSGSAILFDSDGSYTTGATGFFSNTNTDLLLYPDAIPYEAFAEISPGQGKNTFQVSSLGDWGSLVLPRINELAEWSRLDDPMEVSGSEPQYRTFKVIKPNPFTFKVVGVYDFDQISTSIDPFSYVPLGIYEPPTATLKFDENGNQISDQKLYPDLNPGGYIQRPPLALTSLEAAQFILGSDRVINAIRVRVSGVGEYSPENVRKVERVASEILERTGLHVDIVAGSSPQPVLIFVPGKGFIEEQWTSLGAALKISSGINQINIFLYSFLLLSSILFVSNESQLMIIARRKEIGLLKAIGWDDGAIGKRFLTELLRLGILGALLSAVFSFILILALGMKPAWWSIALSSSMIPALYTLSSLPLIRRSVQISPISALNQQDIEDVTEIKPWLSSGLNMVTLVLGSLWRRKARTMLTMFITAIAAALSVTFLYSIFYLRKSLQITLLGEAISISLRSFHIILAISVIALGLLVVLECLLISVMERKNEFTLLQAVGWYGRDISRLVSMESVFQCGAGGLMGGIIGIVICFFLVSHGTFVPWQIGLAVFFGYMLIGAVLSIYPAQVARQTMISNLPASPAEHEKSGLKKLKEIARKPYLYITIGICLLLIIGIGGRKQVVRSVLNMDHTPVPTLTSIEKKIDGRKIVQHIEKLSSLGPRFYANQAEQDAANYIANTLSDYGLRVERTAVPLKAISIVDPEGELVVQFPVRNTLVQGLAVDFQKLTPFSNHPVEIIYKGLDDPWPDARDVSGKALIVENSSKIARNIPMQSILLQYKSAGYPFAFAAVVRKGDDQDWQAIRQPNNRVILEVSEAVTAYLPGSDADQAQIWITARFDSSPDNLGANDALSGVSVMLEAARILAAEKPGGSFRFVALPGLYTGEVGGMAYLYGNPLEKEQAVTVIDVNQLGKWDQLVAEFSFAEPSPWNKLTPDFQMKYKTEGQFNFKKNWQSYIDLSQEDALAAFQNLQRVPLGMGESPVDLVAGMILSGQTMGVTILPGSTGCAGYFHTFLSQDLPTIALCGVGNDLSSTVYDDMSNIQRADLQKAASILYDFILSLIKTEH